MDLRTDQRDKVKGKEFGVAISIGGLEKIMKIAELRWMS